MQIRTQHYITVASQAPQEGEGLEPSQMDLGKLVTIHSTCDFLLGWLCFGAHSCLWDWDI